ncbi:hypothetical protein [Micromonospora sp. LOL_021]|uniref:hypothetical protein n=1 Tax=Micromonospora sp. LOL_021 TaxID=3345417 RepID=UPI003A87CF9E
MLAQALLRQGRPVETLGAVGRAVACSRETDVPAFTASALTDRAVALGGLAQYPAALRDLAEADKLVARIEDLRLADQVRLGMLITSALVHRAVGEPAVTAVLAEQAMELCERHGRREQYLQAKMAWALALVEIGEDERAVAAGRQVYQELLNRGTPHLAALAAISLAALDGRAGRLARPGPGPGGRCGWSTRGISTPGEPPGSTSPG